MLLKSILDLYKHSHFARKWLCDNHCSPKRSGKSSNRFCLNSNADAVDVHPRTTVWCWKGFFGCSKLALAGVICQKKLALVRASAGGDSSGGTNKACGCASGGHFYRNWTRAGDWTGGKAFWTGASLLPKRGRRNRQNQAWEGHEVDGGGRRPRCSSGKPIDQCLALRSKIGRVHIGCHLGSWQWSRSSTKTAAASDRRSRLRQRSFALALAQPRHAADQPASQESRQTLAQRWTNPAPLSQTLESR